MNNVPKIKSIKCINNYGKYSQVPIEKFVFRPSAYGFIIEKGKVVMLTNKSNGKIWPPGGGINLGEKIEDGLTREIFEETGLKVKISKMVLMKENFYYYQPLDEAYHAFLFFFLCQPVGTKLIPDTMVDDLESKKPRWMKISEIKKDDLSDLSNDIYMVLNSLK